ncbi:MAG: hypothetical protein Q7T37_00725 [bacterium]|nr:hypothetical protein [bacterium]MDO8742419.1 hypothetical protein [bacterium]
MSLWVEEILQEIGGISPEQEKFAEPSEALSDCDHVVGVLDGTHGDLRKLLFLLMQYHRYISEIIPTLELYSGEQYEEQVRRVKFLIKKYDALDNIFWISVRSTFSPLKEKDCVAIRKGWKVVWVEKEQSTLDGFVVILGDSRNKNKKPPFDVSWN